MEGTVRSFIEKVLFEIPVIFIVAAVMFWPFMLFMGWIHSQDPAITALGAKDSFEIVFLFIVATSIVRPIIKSLLRKKSTS